MITIKKDFFNADECATAKEEVLSYENMWKKCNQTDMFVLGNSFLRKFSYDNNGGKYYSDYFDNIFSDFRTVSLFKEKLSNMFEKVEFTTNFSRPGFQIIKRDYTTKPAVWHYDNVLMLFPYIKEFTKYNEKFSEYFDQHFIFTLMLSESGSFDYFPETLSSFGNTITESLENIPSCKSHVNLVGDRCTNTQCALTNYQSITYNKGSLLIQEGRFLHRVGISDIDNTKDCRITLQSYGLVKDGTLYLFW